MRNKQFILFSLILLTIIGLPLAIFIVNKQQEIRSRASDQLSTSCTNISFDGKTTVQSSSEKSSAGFSHITADKPNRLLFITIHDDDLPSDRKVKSVTYAGNALSRLIRRSNGSDQGVEAWYLVNPPVGNNQVSVIWEDDVNAHILTAFSYSNVDQTMPIGTIGSNSSSSGNPNISLALKYQNSLIVGALTHDDKNVTLTPASNIVERYNMGIDGNIRGAAGEISATTLTNVNMKWTVSNSSSDEDNRDWSLVAIELKHAACMRCSDKIDNDNNGFMDIDDSSCHTDGNPNNSISYDPAKDGEHGGGGTCADSKDNNYDEFIDGADPMCHTDGNAGNPGSYDPNRAEILAPSPTTEPTTAPIPTPIYTSLLINGLLDGIGIRGDNSNPDGTLSNKNPQHTIRNLNINVFDASNQLIASSTSTMTYSSASGTFAGKIILNNTVTTGNYTVKASTDNHLTRFLTGIQNIIAGQENNLSEAIFITGDIVSDNQLDIRDYNSLIDCYSDLAPPIACEDLQKKLASDLNDDGATNQVDYNLFLREISTQPGQ